MSCIYCILVKDNIIKVGLTTDIKRRFIDHKRDFGKEIKL